MNSQVAGQQGTNGGVQPVKGAPKGERMKRKGHRVTLPSAAFSGIAEIAKATGLKESTIAQAVVEHFEAAINEAAAKISAKQVAQAILTERLAKLGS